jgi:23S rRNA (guanosine2251-2'-O)-methyltransferase
VLVLGSEGEGIRPRVAAVCDELVSIPVRGRVDSLNASVAAAVILFEAMRQSGRAAGSPGGGRRPSA